MHLSRLYSDYIASIWKEYRDSVIDLQYYCFTILLLMKSNVDLFSSSVKLAKLSKSLSVCSWAVSEHASISSMLYRYGVEVECDSEGPVVSIAWSKSGRIDPQELSKALAGAHKATKNMTEYTRAVERYISKVDIVWNGGADSPERLIRDCISVADSKSSVSERGDVIMRLENMSSSIATIESRPVSCSDSDSGSDCEYAHQVSNSTHMWHILHEILDITSYVSEEMIRTCVLEMICEASEEIMNALETRSAVQRFSFVSSSGSVRH